MIVKIKKLDRELPTPKYQTEGSVGFDIYASNNLIVEPGKVGLVKNGFSIELPKGYEAQIRPRSGLALKNKVTVLNTPGTIDSDYRGEVCTIIINHSDEPFFVKKRDRIAQMIIKKVEIADLHEVNELSETERGAGGFFPRSYRSCTPSPGCPYRHAWGNG